MQVLIIFLASIVIWAAIDPSNRNFDAVRIGELIGAGFAFLVFGLLAAHIPATIVRFTRGSWPNWQIWLSVPFVAVFMYFAYIGSSTPSTSGHVATGTQSETRAYWFTEDECEIAVRFPGRPSYRTNHGPGGIQMREAHYNTKDGFHLRAECTDYGGIWDGLTVSARDEDWVGWMGEFMSAEGFNNPQISTKDLASQSDFVVVDGRGYKTVSDVGVTYSIRLVASDKSIMILYAGGPSGRFPSRDASAFLDSYRDW